MLAPTIATGIYLWTVAADQYVSKVGFSVRREETNSALEILSGLTDSDIEQMVQDAEKFAEEDKKRREAAEVRNNLDSLVHATDKQLADNGDKIDAGLKSEIEAAVAEAKTALEGDDIDTMKAKAEALTQVAMKMGQAIYEKEQAAAASPAADAPASGGDEDVVEAEFTEVDDENKS